MVVTVFSPGEIYGYVYTNEFDESMFSDTAARYHIRL